MTTLPPDNMYPCSYKPEPLPRKFPPTPLPFPDFEKHDESRLERFLDKVDANKDGNLSRKEMSEATDTDDNGFVSRSEKEDMKNKLKEYMKDDNAIKRLDSETLGKAQQMLEFLEDDGFNPGPFHVPPHLSDILKELNEHRLD